MEETNSIWRLVAHITFWGIRVVNRLTGTDNPLQFQGFLLPDDPNMENWKQASFDFEAAYHLLRNAIQHLPEEYLGKA